VIIKHSTGSIGSVYDKEKKEWVKPEPEEKEDGINEVPKKFTNVNKYNIPKVIRYIVFASIRLQLGNT
jgi:hypothetical protein